MNINSTNVKGIVLSNKTLNDKDMLADIFTLENGLITVKFKGVKNDKAKLKFAKEPLFFGDFLLNGISDIQTVISCEEIESFYNIITDYNKFEIASKVLLLTKRILHKNQPNAHVFLECLKTLRYLLNNDINTDLCLIKFKIDFLSIMGYKIVLDRCNSCGGNFIGKIFINVDNCEIVCNSCKTNYSIEINKAVQSAIKLLGDSSFDKLGTIKLSVATLQMLNNILNQIIDYRFN